jgi:hypothetical protein
MSLTAIEAVRLKSSDKSSITQEEAVGDGTSKYFKLGHAPILNSPDIEVRKNDVIQIAGYTIDYINGIVTFTAPPPIGDTLNFIYYWSIFTDAEVDYFLTESGSDVTVATARLLLAIAADAAKIAQRQSLAGGGGLGAVTIDTSVTARELRNTAAALLDQKRLEISTAALDPAEGLTEPLWTEFSYQESLAQHIIRES